MFALLAAKAGVEAARGGMVSCKWGVQEAAYLACMEAYLRAETEYGWYLCLDGDRIVGGPGRD